MAIVEGDTERRVGHGLEDLVAQLLDLLEVVRSNGGRLEAFVAQSSHTSQCVERWRRDVLALRLSDGRAGDCRAAVTLTPGRGDVPIAAGRTAERRSVSVCARGRGARSHPRVVRFRQGTSESIDSSPSTRVRVHVRGRVVIAAGGVAHPAAVARFTTPCLGDTQIGWAATLRELGHGRVFETSSVQRVVQLVGHAHGGRRGLTVEHMESISRGQRRSKA